MTNLKKLGILSLVFLLTGCSWEIFPFIRNFTDSVIRIKVVSLQEDKQEFKSVVRSREGIFDIGHDTDIQFADTLKVERPDQNTWTVDLPPRSTSLVQLPYRWRSDQYIITAERANGQVDTLNRTINFVVARKDKKFAQHPRPLTKDMIYYDFK